MARGRRSNQRLLWSLDTIPAFCLFGRRQVVLVDFNISTRDHPYGSYTSMLPSKVPHTTSPHPWSPLVLPSYHPSPSSSL